MSAIDNKNVKLVEKHNRHDLLTKEECQLILEEILKETNERGSLISFEIVPELGTVGYLGEYFHLDLKYQKYGESCFLHKRLFVKTIPYQNPGMSDLLQRAGIVKKESTIYMKLLNELKKFSSQIWCAKCYFAKSDLMVLQNIEDIGYEPIKDVSTFLNRQQIESILEGLAIMHASSCAFEENNQIKIGNMLQDFLFEATVSPKVVWFTAGIKAVLAVALQHPQYQVEYLQLFIKNDLPAILNTVYEMVNPSTKYYNVFCHRDIWAGNVFFAKDEPHEKCAVFVDFQLSRYSPAAIDVLMALYLNMRPRERKLIEKDCFKFYYEHFSQQLLKMGLSAELFITYDDFLHSLKELALFGALYNCIAATVLRVPGDYLKDMKLNRPDDFYRYTNVDRTKEVLELLETHMEFREYMMSCVEDMMDLLLEKS